MGLDFFLTIREMVQLARTFGGQTWLLPLSEDNLFTWSGYKFAHIKEGDSYVPYSALDCLARGGADVLFLFIFVYLFSILLLFCVKIILMNLK